MRHLQHCPVGAALCSDRVAHPLSACSPQRHNLPDSQLCADAFSTISLAPMGGTSSGSAGTSTGPGAGSSAGSASGSSQPLALHAGISCLDNGSFCTVLTVEEALQRRIQALPPRGLSTPAVPGPQGWGMADETCWERYERLSNQVLCGLGGLIEEHCWPPSLQLHPALQREMVRRAGAAVDAAADVGYLAGSEQESPAQPLLLNTPGVTLAAAARTTSNADAQPVTQSSMSASHRGDGSGSNPATKPVRSCAYCGKQQEGKCKLKACAGCHKCYY